jgi:hypothetical protein
MEIQFIFSEGETEFWYIIHINLWFKIINTVKLVIPFLIDYAQFLRFYCNYLLSFYILVTVHLGIILINNQLDAQFLIQGVPGEKDNILEGHSIGHSKQKLYMNMCPIPNGFRDRAILVVWLGHPVLSFPPALLREERSIFWEVIVSVILSKKRYKNVCPIPNGFRDRAIWLYSGLAWGPSIVLLSRPAVQCLKSNGSISEAVRNRTHVHIKFFA